MIGYITLGTADIKRGAEFYDAIGKEMDTPRMMGSEEDGFVAWRKPGDKAGLSIIHPHDGKAMSVGNGSMVALQATEQTHVKRIYDLAFSLYNITHDHSLHRQYAQRRQGHHRAGGAWAFAWL